MERERERDDSKHGERERDDSKHGEREREMTPNLANPSYDFKTFQSLGTPVGLIPSGS